MIEPRLLCHPNIPKPLHGVNPRTIMGKNWWDKERQKVYAERGYHCFACGVHKSDAKYHKWLECHEDYDINYKTGEVKLKRLVALCHCCHSFIHSGLLKVRLDNGDIQKEKYDYITHRGCQLLKKSGLKPWTGSNIRICAEWDKWRLIIDGKEYFSNFKNIDEWRRRYARY